MLIMLLTSRTELHANEDGSIPATFQVIYVVRLLLQIFSPSAVKLMIVSDWVETGTYPTQSFGKGYRENETYGHFVAAICLLG